MVEFVFPWREIPMGMVKFTLSLPDTLAGASAGCLATDPFYRSVIL
jgi:hypothetical protein